MDLKQILLLTQNVDDSIRKHAEDCLKDFENVNLDHFLTSLSILLRDETLDPHIRRLAGLILKNRLGKKSKNQKNIYSYNWLNLNEIKTKEFIKNSIFDVFSSLSRVAKRTASQVMAKIILIELSYSISDDILAFISFFLEKKISDVNFYHSVIETIQFVCQEIGVDLTFNGFLKRYINHLIYILLEGLNDNKFNNSEIKKASLNGLLSLIEVIGDIFVLKNYRDFIMNSIIMQLKNEDVSVRVIVLETLDKIAQNYYQQIDSYIPYLFESTSLMIQSDNELVAIQAIEFWSTIANEEFEINLNIHNSMIEGRSVITLSKNYILKYDFQLLTLLFEYIRNQDKKVAIEEWNSSTAASICLNLISQVVPVKIIYQVICFLDKHLSDISVLGKMENLILIFISIYDGIGAKILYGPARKMLGCWILNLGKNCRKSMNITYLTIGKISTHFPCMIRNLGDQIVQNLLYNLSSQDVSYDACWCLNEMIKPFSKEGIIDWCFEWTIWVIFNRVSVEFQFYKVTNELFEIISSLIINSNTRNIPHIFTVLPFIISKLDKYLGNSKDQSVFNNKETQSYLLRVLSCIFQKFGQKINSKFLEVFLSILSRFLFNQKEKISSHALEEEILVCLGAIIQINKDLKLSNMKNWIHFLLGCIDNCENNENCILAIGVIGDICRTFYNEVEFFTEKILKILVSMLKKNSTCRKTKNSIIICLGDIMLTQGFDLKYFSIVIELFKKTIFFNRCNTLSFDLETFEMDLKTNESILESLTGIIQGCKSNKDFSNFNKFSDKLSWILDSLFQVISNDRMSRTLKICAGLIGDLSFNSDSLVNLLKQENWIFQFLFECKKSRDRKLKGIGSWSFDMVFFNQTS